MSRFKITTSNLDGSRLGTSTAQPSQRDPAEAQVRADALERRVAELERQVQLYSSHTNTVLGRHRTSIDDQGDMIDALWEKLMPAHRAFMAKINTILSGKPKK